MMEMGTLEVLVTRGLIHVFHLRQALKQEDASDESKDT